VGTERGADELAAEERRRLRRAHERLRAASKELEALIATEPIKGRWAPEPAPVEILDAARADLQRLCGGRAKSARGPRLGAGAGRRVAPGGR
jgi:hypothetical protein